MPQRCGDSTEETGLRRVEVNHRGSRSQACEPHEIDDVRRGRAARSGERMQRDLRPSLECPPEQGALRANGVDLDARPRKAVEQLEDVDGNAGLDRLRRNEQPAAPFRHPARL